jgi:hypothetical protein
MKLLPLLVICFLLAGIADVTVADHDVEKAVNEVMEGYKDLCKFFSDPENIRVFIEDWDIDPDTFDEMMDNLVRLDFKKLKEDLIDWGMKRFSDKGINRDVAWKLIKDLIPGIGAICDGWEGLMDIEYNEFIEKITELITIYYKGIIDAAKRVYRQAYNAYNEGKEAIKKMDRLIDAYMSENPDASREDAKEAVMEEGWAPPGEEGLTPEEGKKIGRYEQAVEDTAEAFSTGDLSDESVEQWDPEWVETWTWDPEEGYPQTDVMNPPESSLTP